VSHGSEKRPFLIERHGAGRRPWRLAAAVAADESYTRVLIGLPQISVRSSARKSAVRNQVRVASAAFASAFASAATSRAACSDP
jgi:hypothetical protein